MALLRIGGINPGKRREELLSNYDGEEPYMPGGYDTPYDGEEPYRPEGYDEGYGDYADDDYYDDGYGDDYADGEYYDDGPDRYDNDYGYDAAYGYEGDGDYPPEEDFVRPPYYDAPEYEEERAYPEGWLGEVLRYADENDWVTWLTLVLLPPVGIWLLWRRRRYSQTTNVVLTALSALWMLVVLALLVIKPFRARPDTAITPQPVGAAALPAQEQPEAEAEDAPTTAGVISDEEVDEANAVYVAADGPYYHQSQECSAIPAGATVNRVSRTTAAGASLMACPYCLAGQYSDGTWDLKIISVDTEDRSNMRVYCSPYSGSFHTDASCTELGSGGHEVGLKDALLMGKTACEVCCPDAAREVWCTADGTYYHVKDDCTGMRNASHVTYAEARVTGKKRCPKCIGGVDETEEAADSAAQPVGYYVYATKNGAYYHVNATCSGMKNAQQVLLSDMLKEKRPACPVCCPDAETTVYAQEGNPYYHSYAACSGLTNATQGILVNALAAGLTRCPVCWTSTTT